MAEGPLPTGANVFLRVTSGETGKGLQAYMRIYCHYAGTTGMALSEKARMVMQPTPVKNVAEVAEDVVPRRRDGTRKR